MTMTTTATTLQGVGIGRGLGIGPVIRMPDPLPEPADSPSALDADAEKVRAAGALAATAADIRLRGDRAGGSAKDVLDAQAFMAEDPTLKDDVNARIDDGKTAERAVFEAFAAVPRPAHQHGRLHGGARHRPRRCLAAGRSPTCRASPHPGCPTPTIRSCWSRAISRPPTPHY